MYVIDGGAVFENGNDAPTAGRISIFITVFFRTAAGVPKEICVWFCAIRDEIIEPTPFSWAINVFVEPARVVDVPDAAAV
jgi:hypothetical protein